MHEWCPLHPEGKDFSKEYIKHCSILKTPFFFKNVFICLEVANFWDSGGEYCSLYIMELHNARHLMITINVPV